MIDFEIIKKKMVEDDVKKLDAALARMRTLTPDAREVILNAMEAMIQCEKLKEGTETDLSIHKSDTQVCNKKLSESLKSKYDELKTLAKCIHEVNIDEMKALSKVLRLGTYEDGAKAIDLLIKINLIKYHMDPKFLIESIIDKEMED